MIDNKIINFFKTHSDKYVSGEDLSDTLGISRQALWKHIEKLREEGYEIVASPHLGYRLESMPDILSELELSFDLKTNIIGKKIYSYKEIDSTNDAAYRLALSGEKEGSIVISESQTKGRGRLGRNWVSPKDKGAYFSVILRPDIMPRETSFITLFSSLAICKTIREKIGLSAVIKWPNDVLINNNKICGILTEMNGETDKINFVIIGIGININTKKELLPEGASSLMEEKGSFIPRVDLVKEIFRNIDRYYKHFIDEKRGLILREYKTLSAILDKRIKVSYHNRLIQGHAIDIDNEGALIIRMDSGLNERVLAGDVSILKK
ncbi:MAG: biotin--[acetyl-CoA-carboxylase] ligase [Candidatus Omnitrophota bacterium]